MGGNRNCLVTILSQKKKREAGVMTEENIVATIAPLRNTKIPIIPVEMQTTGKISNSFIVASLGKFSAF